MCDVEDVSEKVCGKMDGDDNLDVLVVDIPEVVLVFVVNVADDVETVVLDVVLAVDVDPIMWMLQILYLLWKLM